MIIVSQDKRILVNFERINWVETSKIDENESIITINYADSDYKIIAKYKTEERAKEVLQEIIQNIYPKSNIDMDTYRISFGVQSPVYEMPLE